MKITDKMRLDFIEKAQAQISRDDNSLAERFICSPIDGDGVKWEPNIRKAIDAAIKQETKSRALKGEKLKGGAL